MLPPEGTPNTVIQHGLVAFFDVLGYSNFLRNDKENTARVVESLNRLPLVSLQKSLSANLFPHPLIVESYGKIQWRVFSDSILLTMDPVESTSQELILLNWNVFLRACIDLWKDMFDLGLPLRGAITKGDYLIQGYCFAGIGIINAHEAGQNLDCAGIMIDDAAVEWASSLSASQTAGNPAYHVLRIHTKSGGEEERTVLNVMLVNMRNKEIWAGDIRERVLRSFSKHNKWMRPDDNASAKLENTIALLESLKAKASLFGLKKMEDDREFSDSNMPEEPLDSTRDSA